MKMPTNRLKWLEYGLFAMAALTWCVCFGSFLAWQIGFYESQPSIRGEFLCLSIGLALLLPRVLAAVFWDRIEADITHTEASSCDAGPTTIIDYKYAAQGAWIEGRIEETSGKGVGDMLLVYANPTRPQDHYTCLLYTSPSPRDRTRSRMPSSA